MSNSFSSEIFDDLDDYPKVTQADLDRATFRVDLKSAPRKQRVTIMLDTDLVEYFKAQAGERGYQSLINETLRQAVQGEELEERLRRIIREEMHRAAGVAPTAT
ncbi:MAG: BrnA antitoxin family protein [Caldilinea sp.]